jgi:outer membrane protein OmpA-like peptidoglycan-associated protein
MLNTNTHNTNTHSSTDKTEDSLISNKNKENLLDNSENRDSLEEEQFNNDDSFEVPVVKKSNHFIDVNSKQPSRMSMIPWWLWSILSVVAALILLRVFVFNGTSEIKKSIGLSSIPTAIQGKPVPLVMPPAPNGNPSPIPSVAVSKDIDISTKMTSTNTSITPPNNSLKTPEATSISKAVTPSVPVVTNTSTNVKPVILLPVQKANTTVDSTVCNVNSLSADVQFLTASSTLTPPSIKSLNIMAKTLNQCPNLNIEVAGHTDSAGHAERHLGLSQRRADSVVDALVKAGVLRQRLASKGYGSTQPIADNTTEEGRFKNRRVEFNIR